MLYDAASFLYELFPSGGNLGTPDLPTISSFFGVAEDGQGGFTFTNEEKLPDNWFNRKAPYTLSDVNREINALYLQYPVLFGGNVEKNNFNALQFIRSTQRRQIRCHWC